MSEDKVDLVFNVSFPIAVALTYMLTRIIFTYSEALELTQRILSCAFLCNVAFVSYSVRKAFQLKKLRVASKTPQFMFVSSDFYTFFDEHIVPLIIAWIGGFFLAMIMLHEYDPLVFTLGFKYFITSRLLTRKMIQELIKTLGEERIEKPRWLLIVGSCIGVVMTLLTVLSVLTMYIVESFITIGQINP